MSRRRGKIKEEMTGKEMDRRGTVPMGYSSKKLKFEEQLMARHIPRE